MKYSFQEELYHAEETTSSYAVLSLHLRRLASNVAGPLHLPERRHQGKPAQGSMSKRVNGEQVRFFGKGVALHRSLLIFQIWSGFPRHSHSSIKR